MPCKNDDNDDKHAMQNNTLNIIFFHKQELKSILCA